MLQLGTLLLTLLLSLSCYAQMPVTVSGVVAGAAPDSIFLGQEYTLIDPKGKFTFIPVLEKPQYQTLRYGKQELELYLEPGKDLLLSLSAEEVPGAVKFAGSLAIVNQYLQQQREINKKVNAYLDTHWGMLFSKPEKAFIATLDSLRQLYLKPLNQLLYADRTLQPWFLMQQRADLTYPFDRWLLSYPEVHRRYTGETVTLSPQAEAYLYRTNLNDVSMLEFESYRQFVRDYLYQIVQLEFEKVLPKKGMDNKWLYAAFKTVPRVIKNKEAREFWLYDYVRVHLEDYGPKNLDSLMVVFQQQVSNSEYRTSIQDRYNTQLQERKKQVSKVYRSIDGYELLAFFNMPEDLKKGERRPALVYFHGGSGNLGMPDWHFGPSPYGFINVSVEYRLRSRHGTLPPEQISDAKVFFRWLRQHAHELGVDTSRIIGSGNSNGGFLLLNTAMASGFNAPGAVKGINPAPNALILQGAAFDAAVNNWWNKYVQDKSMISQASPTAHVRPGLPPMLVIHGTEDNAVPFETAQAFVEKMEKAGNSVKFVPLQGSPHHLWAIPYFRQQAKQEQEAWLRSLGYIN